MHTQVSPECEHFPADVVCDHATANKILGFLDMDTHEGGQAGNVWPGLLVAAFPEFQGMSLSAMLQLLVVRTFRNRCDHTSEMRKCIEFFAGQAEIT
eukprot:5735954-Lingulodinium_polyedra.AAC.1